MAESHRDVIREAKLKKKRLARKRRIASLVLLVILLIVIVALIRSPLFTINQIKVEGLTSEGSEKVTEAVKKNLAGNLYFIIPKSNTFLVSGDELTASLRQSFPSLGEVRVVRSTLNTLKVEAGERKTKALWCEPLSPDSKIQPACYFVDEQGVLYDKAPNFSDGLYLEIEGKLAENPLGGKVMNAKEFSNLYSFSNNLPELFKTFSTQGTSTWKVLKLNSMGAGDFAVQMQKGEGESLKVLFNKSQGAWELATNLNSVFNSKDFQKEFQSGAKLDSIDLRFGQKVFYRIKQN